MMLSQCFDGLKTYGKEPEQIAGTVGLFRMVLADFTLTEIKNAFRVYLSRNNEMPTPADIAQIIRRGGKPPFNQSVYIRLEKKGYDARTFEEDAYMAEYEADAFNGGAGIGVGDVLKPKSAPKALTSQNTTSKRA